MKGRAPKSTELKLARGTRADRVNKARPAAKAGRPECPDRFDGETRAEWDRLCGHLASVGVLNAGHGFALSIYCGAYSRLLGAEKALAEHGPLLVREQGPDDLGMPQPPVIKSNPAAAVAARCESQMARVLSEFGLTPASAERVGSGAEAPPDRFAEFLKKKASR